LNKLSTSKAHYIVPRYDATLAVFTADINECMISNSRRAIAYGYYRSALNDDHRSIIIH